VKEPVVGGGELMSKCWNCTRKTLFWQKMLLIILSELLNLFNLP